MPLEDWLLIKVSQRIMRATRTKEATTNAKISKNQVSRLRRFSLANFMVKSPVRWKRTGKKLKLRTNVMKTLE
jgi:hypothetical protein